MQDGLAAMCGASPAERAKLGGLPDDARGMLGAQIAFIRGALILYYKAAIALHI